jgi:hypothetical protein
MDENLLKKYREYASSEEACAVLFVKTHLDHQAKEHWVDIADYRSWEKSPNKFHFRFVVGRLYKKRIRPKYPPESAFTIDGKFDERRHDQMVRAITWETANRDIEQQKAQNVAPAKFKVTGVFYEKIRSAKDYFRGDAPPEIKALANNLRDRTDPLWDKAIRYVMAPEFVYEIKQIRVSPPRSSGAPTARRSPR